MENQTVTAKKRIFSGIQPTGNLTLGNYIGALRNFKLLEDEYDCLYSIVDLHALTVRQNPAELRKACLRTMAIFLASGLDPEKNIIYFQSQVAAHAELAWILDCFTYMGELSRMTQFKDKSAKHADNINCGLFAYPVLMAADILLYMTDLVPIGADQKQHLEITRDIAERFNALYGDVFVMPEAYIPKVGARVMSLQEPTRKMSKSDPEETYIAILDKPDVIRRKLRRAVTDSENRVLFDPENRPGVSNLMSIMGALTGRGMDDISAEYDVPYIRRCRCPAPSHAGAKISSSPRAPKGPAPAAPARGQTPYLWRRTSQCVPRSSPARGLHIWRYPPWSG